MEEHIDHNAGMDATPPNVNGEGAIQPQDVTAGEGVAPHEPALGEGVTPQNIAEEGSVTPPESTIEEVGSIALGDNGQSQQDPDNNKDHPRGNIELAEVMAYAIWTLLKH